MPTYYFDLIFLLPPDDAGSDAWETRIGEAAEKLYPTCSDGTFGRSCGVEHVSFAREAESLEAAINSAIADVMAGGYAIARVVIEPFEIGAPLTAVPVAPPARAKAPRPRKVKK
jgi:hypothetical protein